MAKQSPPIPVAYALPVAGDPTRCIFLARVVVRHHRQIAQIRNAAHPCQIGGRRCAGPRLTKRTGVSLERFRARHHGIWATNNGAFIIILHKNRRACLSVSCRAMTPTYHTSWWGSNPRTSVFGAQGEHATSASHHCQPLDECVDHGVDRDNLRFGNSDTAGGDRCLCRPATQPKSAHQMKMGGQTLSAIGLEFRSCRRQKQCPPRW